MEAKEKAKEIIQMIFESQHNDDKAKLIMISTFEIALILVNEIIHEVDEVGRGRRAYWNAVRTEILRIKQLL